MSQQHESEETEQPASRLNDIQVVDTRTFPDFLHHEALLLDAVLEVLVGTNPSTGLISPSSIRS